MREIKFRAWDKIDKKMIGPFGFLEACYILQKDNVFTDQELDISFDLIQYTGLKDKNGVEIYEGDIINFTGIVTAPNDRFGKEWHEQCIVEFDSGCFKPFNAPYSNGKSSEIIGNIYENPELLNRHC